MKCPACSASIPNTALRCSSCGKAVDRTASIAQAMKTVQNLKAEAKKTEAGLPTETLVRVAVIGAVVLGLLWSAGAVLRSVLSGRSALAPAPAPAPVPAPPPPPAEAPAEEAPMPQPVFVPPNDEAPAPKRASGAKPVSVDPGKAKEIPAPQPTRERADGTWESSLPAMGGGGR